MTRHIAQLNIGRFRYPTDDPRMAAFMTNLDRINDAIRPASDPTIAVNLSVWESVEALERFVWMTVHKQFYNRKGDWFQKPGTPHFVMWPILSGHIPNLEEASGRLAHLTVQGDSDFAFGWSHLPHIKLWMSRKCG